MEDCPLPDVKAEPVSRLDRLKFLGMLTVALISDFLRPGPRLSDEEYLRQVRYMFGSNNQSNEANKD